MNSNRSRTHFDSVPGLLIAAITIALVRCGVYAAPKKNDPEKKATPPAKSKPHILGDSQEDAEAGELFGETSVLVSELTRRGMPELVESLLRDYPPACRIYVARAYVYAARNCSDVEARSVFTSRATREYQDFIAREQSPQWLEDDRRRFLSVQARMEWAGMILRYECGEDLDQFELTSGLQFERERLASKLRRAVDLYAQGRVMLDAMEIILRTQEERYLLLGLTEKVLQLAVQCRVDNAWAQVYLAMISEPQAADRNGLLIDALAGFDRAADSGRDVATKYNALVGAGIALRESGQLREAQAAFDRVIDSTASIGVVARARYESARAMIQGRQYEEARRQLDTLGRIPPERFKGEDSGGKFYLRLAPLIHAYATIREYQQTERHDAQREKLRERAMRELDDIARKNPSWQVIVKVYLDQVSGGSQDFAKMSEMQLSMAAQDAMHKENYAAAIAPLQILADRPSAGEHRDQARFNLGVCLFQTGQLRAAGNLFLKAAESGSNEIARPCAEYALRVWSRCAADSKSADDYHKLAQAGDLLVKKFPDHSDADDARWMAAIARQESGDLSEAIEAYEAIPRNSPHYADALRNAAIGFQTLVERIPAGQNRKEATRKAAGAWLKVAEGEQKDQRRIHECRVAAATLLIRPELQDYQAASTALEKLGNEADVMLLRFRCLRGLGRIDEARQILRTYLAGLNESTNEPALLQWTRQIQQEIDNLKGVGREDQIRQAAADGVLVLEQLLEWLPSHTQYANFVPAVRIALIETLRAAGREQDAAARVEKFLANDSANGNLLFLAASIAQKQADAKPGANGDSAAAERLWSKLLQDQTLRDNHPAMYWEARYFWLRHQMDHGKAQEVVKGIATEEAWYPDLGGPPWQARLLELADEARAATERSTP